MKETAERLYHKDPANNFVFQRSLLAYVDAASRVSGDVLELGTGQGYGIEVVAPSAQHYKTLDKFEPDPSSLAHDNVLFVQTSFPPLDAISDESFDYVISFQVIEHIQDDHAFVAEAARVLRPGGQFIVTTPNKLMSLTRNPWHVREYTVEELYTLLGKYFDHIEPRGVFGNEKITAYYQKNKESVERITRLDIFNLQHRLPRRVLQWPYDLLNKLNRSRLLSENTTLVNDINMDDYYIDEANETCYDLFYIATKSKS